MKILAKILMWMSKVFHKLFVEPIKKGLLLSCGSNVHIGVRVTGNLENIIVGNNVSIGSNNLFLSKNANIYIGNDVMFGPGVSVITGDHRIDLIGKKMIDITEKEKLPENDQDVIFKGDNWIGANVIILKGVTIGEGSIIAAGSVVNKNVEPYSIYGGIPAKKIRMRFNKEQLGKHLELLEENNR